MINLTIYAGHLTRDPELRTTPNGKSVVAFSIANNRTWRDEGGNEHEDVCFLDVEAWGKTAETIAKWFQKGKPIQVQGHLKLDQWEDKATGQKRSRIKMVAERFFFVGGNKDDGGEQHEQQGEQRQSPPPQQRQQSQQRSSQPPPRRQQVSENLDEDVPF